MNLVVRKPWYIIERTRNMKHVRRTGLTVVIAIILMNLCNLISVGSFTLKDMVCVALGIMIGDVIWYKFLGGKNDGK